ncbi:MAG: prolipoprotein diacylglyceryl transferase [Candidatus Neomarinimicrobiota bacterium]|nr:MAG: prolipoprotein diacylglyceryl transferase [Candidatus Neomarinimicrobiota bacterium]
MKFVDWWQHLPSHMNPVFLHLGGLSIRWYSLMYLVAFAIVYRLSLYRLEKEEWPFTKQDVGDMITWSILGVLLGGRLGYVLFYGKGMFWSEPWKIFFPFSKYGGSWHFTGIAGMSYHGGLLGVMVALYWFSRTKGFPFLRLGDFLTPSIPLGFTFGRIGNFINGELYGRITTASIGMYFPEAGGTHLRHPSQLYEAFFEGLVLFAITWPLRKKGSFSGFSSGLYVFGYGFFRFFIEFFRQPDAHMGFVLGPFSMGQVLCFGMMVIGIVLWQIGLRSSSPNA